jgi:hypothetical protein
MAQDFERTLKEDISNNSGSPTVLRTAADSDDAIIGIRCANIAGTSVNISVYVKNGSDKYFIIKDAPIPTGGSLELIDGGSKVVLQSGDSVEAYASAASSVDIITSVVDTISA